MNYERFKRAVMEQILDHLPDGRKGWTVKMEQVRKVNRLLDGMVLIPPKEWEARHGVGITFYMEDYYTLFRKGMPLEQILEQIGQMTLNCAPPDTLKEAFFHPERMKHQIVMELVHRERNQTLLEDLPHRDFLDLAVIYRILMKDEERGYFCTTISYNMMKLLEMTEEALYQAACLYMPSELPFGVRNFDGKFIILSNSSQMFGASALLFPDVLDMACEALGGDVYILPASGDKICLEIANPQRLEELQKMVWDFYHMGNDPEDMLSDQIYFYRMHSGQVQITEQAARVAEGEGGVS